MLLVVEGGHLQRAPVEILHHRTETGNDATTTASANRTKAALDDVVFLVFHDAAVVNIAVDGHDTIPLSEKFDDPVRSGFDPAGVVRCDTISLIKGTFPPFVATPDRVKATETGHRDNASGIGSNRLLQPGETVPRPEARALGSVRS